MTADDLAKMFASWTEDRVRSNIIETMAELEQKTNILSSSYRERVQQYKVETTKELTEVQLAPVTKEVFVTVLDSLQGSSTVVTKPASKQQFVSHLHKMVNKIKTFPKCLRPSRKAAKELSITPEVCKTLSDLLAAPDSEGSARSTQSSTSLHSNEDRLYGEDNFNRASENVQNILFASAAASSSQEGIIMALQSDASSHSVSSVKSVHDDARGIVGTLVTDLEELYESMEPTEREMLQNQNIKSQKLAEPETDDAQNSPEEMLQSREKEEAEPTKKYHATVKSFNHKIFNILCRTQIKLRLFFTLHGSQDIVPDPAVQPSTEDGCQEDAELEEPCREDADDSQRGSEEAEAEPATGTIPSATAPSYEVSSSSGPTRTSPKAGSLNVRKKLKQMFTRPGSPPTSTVTPSDAQEMVSSLPETDDSGYDAAILSPESPIQQSMALLSQTALQDDHFTLDDDTCQDEQVDNTEAGASPVGQASAVPETVAAVTSDNKKHSLGKKFKTIFTKQPKGSTDAPEVSTEQMVCSDGEEFTAEWAELGIDSVTETIAETAQASQSSPTPEEATTLVISHGKRNSLEKKFKKLFAKQPTSSNEAPNIPEDTREAEEQLASSGGEFSDECAELGDSFTDTITDTTRVSQPAPTPAAGIPGGNKPRIGKNMKIFFAKQPKGIKNAPTMHVETPEGVSRTLDEAVQRYMTSEFETCPGDEQLASTDGEEFQDEEMCDSAIKTIAETAQASQPSPTSETPAVVASDRNKHSIGRKFKSLFVKQPSSVPPPVTPVDNQVQTGDGPDAISLASEAIVQQSIALAYETVCKDESLVSSVGADYQNKCNELSDRIMEAAVHTASVSQAPHASETPVAMAADGNRPGLGKKFKNLFGKQPKILTAGPKAQWETMDVVSSMVETEDGGSGPDLALLASEAPLMQTMAPSSQTCLLDGHTTVAPDGEEVGSERFALGKTDVAFEESQVPPMSEPPVAMAVAAEGGNKRSIGKTLKTLFARQPRNVREGTKVPPDSQEPVLSPLDETALQAAESRELEVGLWASEASVEQEMSTSLDQSATNVPTEDPAPLCENVNVWDDAARVSISPGPLSDTTRAEKKHGLLQIGNRLKNVFTKQPRPPRATKATPADTHEVVPTEKDTLTPSAGHPNSSSPPMPTAPEFTNRTEARAAIRDVMERLRHGLEDVGTATAKIELLMEQGVLRPFVRELVDKIFNFMSTTSSSGANSHPRRSSSDRDIQMAGRRGMQRRELVLDANLELVYAFACRAVKSLLVFLLGMFLPLIEEAGVEFLHDIMVKRAISEVSLSSTAAVDSDVRDSVDE